MIHQNYEILYTSPIISEYFDTTIPYAGVGADVSFTAALRCLLDERIQKSDFRLNMYFHGYKNTDDLTLYLYPDTLDLINVIVAHNIASYDSAILNIKTRYSEYYVENEQVKNYFHNIDNIAVFINESCQNTAIVVNAKNDMTTSMHNITSIIPILLPWHFQTKPLTTKEIHMLSSVTVENKSFVEKINKIAEDKQIFDKALNKLLSQFSTSWYQRELEDIKYKISQNEHYIEQLLSNIKNNLIEKERLLHRERGLMLSMGDQENCDFVDYISHNKSIIIDKVQNGVFSFAVRTHLDDYDEDMVQAYLNNQRSSLYDNNITGTTFSNEEKARAIEEIFIHRNYKLNVISAFYFDGYEINIYNLNSAELYTFNKKLSCAIQTSMQHPHLSRYHCLGNNQAAIISFLNDGKKIEAIEQAVAATQNINWGDAVVIEHFLGLFFYENHNKYIEDLDGNSYNLEEYMNIIKEKING